jgi:hypothetical protein
LNKLDSINDESIYYASSNPDALHHILATQHNITQYMQNRGDKRLFQILIIIEDFADSPDFSRKSRMLHTLYIRGRHNYISKVSQYLVRMQCLHSQHTSILLSLHTWMTWWYMEIQLTFNIYIYIYIRKYLVWKIFLIKQTKHLKADSW